MYLSWVGYFSATEKQALYRPEFRAQVAGQDSGDFLRRLFRKSEQLDGVNRLEYVDLASFLACNCLEYADRMSMANSLEIRCPFTDQKLIEFALHLRSSFKVHGMQAKWALKAVMEGFFPRKSSTRRKWASTPRCLNG
jgi:asparagine synthase (glutamine-hydrolysing)